MDYRFSFQRPMRRSSFGSMKGTIVDLVPAGQGGRRADGCLLCSLQSRIRMAIP